MKKGSVFNLSALLMVGMLLSACSQTSPTDSNPQAVSQQTQVGVSQQTSEEVTENDYGIALKDGNILYSGEKVGTVKDGKIQMTFWGNTYAFPGEVGKIMVQEKLLDNEEFAIAGFNYDGVDVGTSMDGQYAKYKVADISKFSFTCKGTLFTFAETGKEVPHYGCETDGKTYWTQYELNSAYMYGVGVTGGEGYDNWNKMYVRKIGDKNLVFVADFSHQIIPTGAAYDEPAKYKEVSTKAALDKLLNDVPTRELIGRWDAFVKSVEEVK